MMGLSGFYSFLYVQVHFFQVRGDLDCLLLFLHSRNFAGETPKFFLNTHAKYSASSKPIFCANSAILIWESSNNKEAEINILVLTRYSFNVTCLMHLKSLDRYDGLTLSSRAIRVTVRVPNSSISLDSTNSIA